MTPIVGLFILSSSLIAFRIPRHPRPLLLPPRSSFTPLPTTTFSTTQGSCPSVLSDLQHWRLYACPERVPGSSWDGTISSSVAGFGRPRVRRVLSGGRLATPEPWHQETPKRRSRSRISPRPSTRSTPGPEAAVQLQHQKIRRRRSCQTRVIMSRTRFTAKAWGAILQTALLWM